MTIALALLLGLAAGECQSPPSRTSGAYWGFIDACGCANLQAPSRASSDHDRYLKACASWRERNPAAVRPWVSPSPLPPGSPAPPRPSTIPGATPVPLATPVAPAEAPVSAECAHPPSRVSGGYWPFIDACGCASVEAPSRASADYERYEKACAQWRERNQRPLPSPAP